MFFPFHSRRTTAMRGRVSAATTSKGSAVRLIPTAIPPLHSAITRRHPPTSTPPATTPKAWSWSTRAAALLMRWPTFGTAALLLALARAFTQRGRLLVRLFRPVEIVWCLAGFGR